jgi:hypothetical protein
MCWDFVINITIFRIFQTVFWIINIFRVSLTAYQQFRFSGEDASTKTYWRNLPWDAFVCYVFSHVLLTCVVMPAETMLFVATIT